MLQSRVVDPRAFGRLSEAWPAVATTATVTETATPAVAPIREAAPIQAAVPTAAVAAVVRTAAAAPSTGTGGTIGLGGSFGAGGDASGGSGRVVLGGFREERDLAAGLPGVRLRRVGQHGPRRLRVARQEPQVGPDRRGHQGLLRRRQLVRHSGFAHLFPRRRTRTRSARRDLRDARRPDDGGPARRTSRMRSTRSRPRPRTTGAAARHSRGDDGNPELPGEHRRSRSERESYVYVLVSDGYPPGSTTTRTISPEVADAVAEVAGHHPALT